MTLWPGAKTPDLRGKRVIVTGANSGIGYYTAQELARAGAEVILACRNPVKGEAAARQISQGAVFMPLDLADLDSVRAFAADFNIRFGTLDILVNNAGVMMPPQRLTTKQGFELQFGVNFLGHFLLTALLLGALQRAPMPRAVQVASIAHRSGKINFADLQTEHPYHAWMAYRQSKLASLIFAQELARRSAAGGWGVLSVAAHPGIAATELVANGPGAHSLAAFGLAIAKHFIFQSAEAGAWPSILAVTDAAAQPGAYYGPQGWREMRGRPGSAEIKPQALDKATATRLWETAETLVGQKLTPNP